jgi:hypothetical protein
MNTKKLAGILILLFIFIMGCSGSYRKKLQTIDSKVTHQELIDNWSDYNILFNTRTYFGITVIVFDPKNDVKKISVGGRNWRTVKDQKTWTEFAKENKTSDGNFKLPTGKETPTQTRGTTGVLEIWGPDNQQYGFFIRQERLDFVFARMVDENTLRVSMLIPTVPSPAK